MRDVPYYEAMGSLMWACLGMRSDIAFAVTTLSRYTKNPGMPHWDVKQVFWYMKGTKDLWLQYGGEEKKELIGYSDADGSMAEDQHAVNGYIFILNGGAILWSCKRQELVSLSTTESKYIGMIHATKEALWIRSRKSSETSMMLLSSLVTTSQPLRSPKTTSTTLAPST